MSCVNLNGAQKSGTGVTDVDADSSMISFSNNGTTKFDMLGDSTINTDLLLANTKGLNFKDAAGNTVPGVTMDSGDNLIIGDVNGNLDAITIKTQNGQTMTFQHGAAPSLTILDGAVDVPNGAFTVATDKFTVTSAGHVTIGDGTAGVDYAITIVGQNSTGIVKWMEDEDYFQFADAVLLDLTLTVSGTTHSTGRLSAGLLGTDGTAHILTASAGTVAANANADEGVFENSGNTGISILAPDANVCSVYFGTPSDNLGAFFQWDFTSKDFTMGSHIAGGTLSFSTDANVEAMTIDASQDVTVETGNLIMPKTSGVGIKVDTTTPTFGWKDLIGEIGTKNTGATKPSFEAYNGAVLAFRFSAGDEEYLEFHMPHDYVPGSDLYVHVHWSQISTTNTGGTLNFKYTAVYASGYDADAFTGTPIAKTFTSADAGTTQYQHHITEIQLSATTPTAGEQFDSDDLEVDGLILMTMEMDANNLTDSSSVTDPFIHYVDIHYQTTGVMGTKDKNTPFYT